ncbi:uncharacterized protein METZ01_LOCUS242190 [marine metagenome]|uniref:Uncharacterized protein n=1 Tax=marine metagenome TaxID=408172 RepID=A0A382HPT6_9ZZZZ
MIIFFYVIGKTFYHPLVGVFFPGAVDCISAVNDSKNDSYDQYFNGAYHAFSS